MVKYRQQSLWATLLLLMTMTTSVYAASIKVTLDQDVVPLNESFTIFFQTTEKVDGAPDFSPLEQDFRIVSQQKRSNLSYINGKSTRSTEWILEVMAKRDGVLTIPAISFGKDKSPATQVTIKNAPVVTQPGATGQADQADDEIFIEVEASPETTWVQAQIIYTIRLFRSVNTFNASLSEPKISGGQMIAEKLEDRQYETTRNNKTYLVLERRYALFPQVSGRFTLEPIVFTGQISQRSRSLFDPFGQNSKTVQRLSRTINLNIKPIPADYTGQTWLPARNIQINEKWLKNNLQLTAGEPVTRSIVIRAEGLTSEQLPEIGVSDLDNFKLYPDQPEMHNQNSRDGILGIRQEKSAVIPDKAGEFTLPAIKLNWWNTQTGKMEVAELPERVINVLPGSTGEQQADKGSDGDQNQTETAESANPVKLPANDKNYWPWVSLLLALGWLGTGILWWKQKGINRQQDLESKPVLTERSTMRSLRESIRNSDPVMIKDALLRWSASIWGDNPPANLAELGQRCGHPLEDELALLNRNLYSSADQQWDRERLLLAVENFDGQRMQKEKTSGQPELTPLHNI